jgi:hypothetical protein
MHLSKECASAFWSMSIYTSSLSPVYTPVTNYVCLACTDANCFTLCVQSCVRPYVYILQWKKALQLLRKCHEQDRGVSQKVLQKVKDSPTKNVKLTPPKPIHCAVQACLQAKQVRASLLYAMPYPNCVDDIMHLLGQQYMSVHGGCCVA